MQKAWQNTNKRPKTQNPKKVIINMAHGRQDHAYLYAAFKMIDRGDVIARKTFAFGYQQRLKDAGLIHHEGSGAVKLTKLGQTTYKYMQDSKEAVAKGVSRGFSHDHLRKSLINPREASAITRMHFVDAGYGGSRVRLSKTGMQARDYLATLETAKWKRAGKPQPTYKM